MGSTNSSAQRVDGVGNASQFFAPSLAAIFASLEAQQAAITDLAERPIIKSLIHPCITGNRFGTNASDSPSSLQGTCLEISEPFRFRSNPNSAPTVFPRPCSRETDWPPAPEMSSQRWVLGRGALHIAFTTNITDGFFERDIR